MEHLAAVAAAAVVVVAKMVAVEATRAGPAVAVIVAAVAATTPREVVPLTGASSLVSAPAYQGLAHLHRNSGACARASPD